MIKLSFLSVVRKVVNNKKKRQIILVLHLKEYSTSEQFHKKHILVLNFFKYKKLLQSINLSGLVLTDLFYVTPRVNNLKYNYTLIC